MENFESANQIGSGKNRKSLFFLLGLKYTYWGHVVSLKSVCQIPVLSSDIRYASFLPAKFISSFQKWADNLNSNSWHLVKNKQIIILSFLAAILNREIKPWLHPYLKCQTLSTLVPQRYFLPELNISSFVHIWYYFRNVK